MRDGVLSENKVEMQDTRHLRMYVEFGVWNYKKKISCYRTYSLSVCVHIHGCGMWLVNVIMIEEVFPCTRLADGDSWCRLQLSLIF